MPCGTGETFCPCCFRQGEELYPFRNFLISDACCPVSISEDPMFVIVIYDIPDNKRRTRLFKALKGFGTPVQFSAFECILTDKHFREMQEVIRNIIDCSKDKCRIYTLCNGCRVSIKNVGTGEVVKDRNVIIV
ncbi:MAG: CRISPR-associated endonuclease Cas2 [wastewater metagenome]|nr:CRISPR-associated endonuclease Cas2 [Candidatus Loosdrechtia aerotolerans]